MAARWFLLESMCGTTPPWQQTAVRHCFGGGGVSVNRCVPGFIFQPFTPGFPTGLGVYIDPTIEYYNRSLDHYFITSSQPDIDALDSGRTPGWERTGESFPAWISVLDSCGGDGAASPPTLK